MGLVTRGDHALHQVAHKLLSVLQKIVFRRCTRMFIFLRKLATNWQQMARLIKLLCSFENVIYGVCSESVLYSKHILSLFFHV